MTREAGTRAGTSWLPLLALVAISSIWGLTWVVQKAALQYAGPFVLAAQRCVGGAVALCLVARLTGRPLRVVAPWRMLPIALTQVTGFMAFQNWALVATGAGKAAVLIFTMPVWTLLLAGPVLGERVRGLQWVAAGTALAGLTLIIGPWQLQVGLVGTVLGLAAAVCWATGTVLVKRLRRTQDVDAVVLTTWQMVIGTVPLVAIAFAVPHRPTVWSPAYAASLLFLSLCSTALAWWLWSYILNRLPAWEASLSVIGTPAIAIVSSAVLLGERFRPREVGGMLLIGAGLALLTVAGWRAQRRAPNPSLAR